MAEMKLTGNCLRGSRPLLSFDPQFTEKPHYTLIKELLIQIFGVPFHHPKSQPFFDHVYTFTVLDNRIWFRNFQILSEDGALAEVGPRFVLNPIKLFSGSFGGESLWENPSYRSPAKLRQLIKKKYCNKYINRVEHKQYLEDHKPGDGETYALTPLHDIFQGSELVKAEAIEAANGEGDGGDEVDEGSSDDEVLRDEEEMKVLKKQKQQQKEGKKKKKKKGGKMVKVLAKKVDKKLKKKVKKEVAVNGK